MLFCRYGVCMSFYLISLKGMQVVINSKLSWDEIASSYREAFLGTCTFDGTLIKAHKLDPMQFRRMPMPDLEHMMSWETLLDCLSLGYPSPIPESSEEVKVFPFDTDCRIFTCVHEDMNLTETNTMTPEKHAEVSRLLVQAFPSEQATRFSNFLTPESVWSHVKEFFEYTLRQYISATPNKLDHQMMISVATKQSRNTLEIVEGIVLNLIGTYSYYFDNVQADMFTVGVHCHTGPKPFMTVKFNEGNYHITFPQVDIRG